jgi:omega-6 fatty acid desaturase (delta-12 desaturase)
MSFTREETSIFYGRSLVRGVGMFLVDCAVLAICTYLALTVSPWPLQAVFSFLMGTVIASLFAIGHDAAHDSLTPHRGQGRRLGAPLA